MLDEVRKGAWEGRILSSMDGGTGRMSGEGCVSARRAMYSSGDGAHLDGRDDR